MFEFKVGDQIELNEEISSDDFNYEILCDIEPQRAYTVTYVDNMGAHSSNVYLCFSDQAGILRKRSARAYKPYGFKRLVSSIGDYESNKNWGTF